MQETKYDIFIWLYIFVLKNLDNYLYMLEYITYPGASTISLSFWLSWSLDMVSEANVRGHGFESSWFLDNTQLFFKLR